MRNVPSISCGRGNQTGLRSHISYSPRARERRHYRRSSAGPANLTLFLRSLSTPPLPVAKLPPREGLELNMPIRPPDFSFFSWPLPARTSRTVSTARLCGISRVSPLTLPAGVGTIDASPGSVCLLSTFWRSVMTPRYCSRTARPSSSVRAVLLSFRHRPGRQA